MRASSDPERGYWAAARRPRSRRSPYLAILGGIGTAGVPAGSIPFVILILVSIGVSSELIGIILGVDRILDMCRTRLNVTGDITAAAYVVRSEGFPLLEEAQAAA